MTFCRFFIYLLSTLKNSSEDKVIVSRVLSTTRQLCPTSNLRHTGDYSECES